MKKIILLLTILCSAFNINSQNITNTLGASGLFSIKDGSTTMLSLNQTDGYLRLKSGVIFYDATRFIHSFQAPGTYGQNTFVGLYSGNFTMGGINSYEASYNTGIGVNSLSSLTTGYNNSALGLFSLYTNSSGASNSAFGGFSMYKNTTGYNNCAFGTSSLYENINGVQNSAFGNQSMYSNTTGGNNSAFGNGSLFGNTTGSSNCAFGNGSLSFNNIGNDNSAFGYQSLSNNTTGHDNSAFGFQSLRNNLEGFNNTAVGFQALLNNKGNYNTAVGFNSGTNVTTGANLTMIGIDANPSSPTALDEITLGNQYVQTLRCNVTSITSLSDARDKKNIKDLSLGLDFLMKVHPRQFNWDRREWYSDGKSDGSKMQDVPTAGFIAQELDKAQTDADAEWLKLVLKENPDRIEASSGNLFPIVVKAVQDLKIEKDFEIAQLKNENEKLSNQLESIKELQTRLTKLEQTILNSDVKFSSNVTE